MAFESLVCCFKTDMHFWYETCKDVGDEIGTIEFLRSPEQDVASLTMIRNDHPRILEGWKEVSARKLGGELGDKTVGIMLLW